MSQIISKAKVQGFALIELVIVAAVLGVLGFATWRVISSQPQSQAALKPATQQAVAVPALPAIKDTAGLKAVESKLDSATFDDSSLDKLDSALNF